MCKHAHKYNHAMAYKSCIHVNVQTYIPYHNPACTNILSPFLSLLSERLSNFARYQISRQSICIDAALVLNKCFALITACYLLKLSLFDLVFINADICDVIYVSAPLENPHAFCTSYHRIERCKSGF